MSEEPGEITRLLGAMRSGDSVAERALFARAYDELLRIARSHVRRSGQQLSINPQTLVHEAYLKFSNVESIGAESGRHFYNIMARAMRQVLMDLARKKKTRKHGVEFGRATLDENEAHQELHLDQLVGVDAALTGLEKFDKDLAEVFQLHFFGGLEPDELASLYHVSDRTMRRRIAASRAVIVSLLEGS